LLTSALLVERTAH